MPSSQSTTSARWTKSSPTRSDPSASLCFCLLFLGSVALLLSSIGLYALIAYSVSVRRHEIGIRIAIGAQPADIRRLILLQGLKLTAIGVLAGLAGSLAATRLMRGVLYGVSPTDPLTLLSVAAALFAAALLACYVPARSAVGIRADHRASTRVSAGGNIAERSATNLIFISRCNSREKSGGSS